jgi:histidinol-phosphate/aromatic aminotransferase/cobyric acid decarboxylase-like protein/choline kinase
MLPVNGRPLGAYTLDSLAAAGVSRIVLVVGHGADEVREYVGTRFRGIPVEYVHNDVYARTNNIYSLLLAGDELKTDDSIVLESDVLVDPSIIADCVAARADNLAVVARYESWMDGTVALLGPSGAVSRLVPKEAFNLADRPHYYKTVNIYRFASGFSRNRLVPHLSRYVVEHGAGAFYEQVLEALIAMPDVRLAALHVGDRRWYEIDDTQDLEIAETLFASDDERPNLLTERFGGYWRFGQLVDFAYLSNPFFPPARLLEEIGADVAHLARAYPSGQLVQRKLMGRLFDCDPDLLLVGNGASELIRALIAELDDARIGVVRPTFEEYPRWIAESQLAEFQSSGAVFRYAVDELLAFAREQRLATLVLVNPDNPSGHFLPRNDVLTLLRRLEGLGTTLVLDESFVDFVDGTLDHSLLCDDVLRQHQNLVIVRSLGKSHGIPGLRLGVLASADPSLRRRLEDRLPIWNVNSVAEAFLQRAPRYRAEYLAACAHVVTERAQLLAALARLEWLRPIPSAANFVLCELASGLSAQSVVRHLLSSASILVKDCSAKRGLGRGQFVRMAVHPAEDNARLLSALTTFDATDARSKSSMAAPA